MGAKPIRLFGCGFECTKRVRRLCQGCPKCMDQQPIRIADLLNYSIMYIECALLYHCTIIPFRFVENMEDLTIPTGFELCAVHFRGLFYVRMVFIIGTIITCAVFKTQFKIVFDVITVCWLHISK